MMKLGRILTKPKYLTIYDFVAMVIVTMFQFMIWSNDQVAKGIIVLMLFLKCSIGWFFIKAERDKWIRYYFWIRIGFDFIIIGPVCLIMTGTDAFTILNWIFSGFFIVGSEVVWLLLVFKFLNPERIDTKLPALKEIEKHKKEQRIFYSLANLEMNEMGYDFSLPQADENPLQRIVKRNEEEMQRDIEERFKFVNMDDYRKKNISALNYVDTLEKQYHTSVENTEFKKSTNNELKHFSFHVPGGDISHAQIDLSNNEYVKNRPINVDLFQRLKEKPKVTRQRTENITKSVSQKTSKLGKLFKKSKKPEPSNKNRIKIDETLHSTLENKERTPQKPEKIIQQSANQQVPIAEGIINKSVILSMSNTGNIIIVPKLPSLERDRRVI